MLRDSLLWFVRPSSHCTRELFVRLVQFVKLLQIQRYRYLSLGRAVGCLVIGCVFSARQRRRSADELPYLEVISNSVFLCAYSAKL